jgi:hypothetical protein
VVVGAVEKQVLEETVVLVVGQTLVPVTLMLLPVRESQDKETMEDMHMLLLEPTLVAEVVEQEQLERMEFQTAWAEVVEQEQPLQSLVHLLTMLAVVVVVEVVEQALAV